MREQCTRTTTGGSVPAGPFEAFLYPANVNSSTSFIALWKNLLPYCCGIFWHFPTNGKAGTMSLAAQGLTTYICQCLLRIRRSRCHIYIFTGTHFGASIVMYALSPTDHAIDHVQKIYCIFQCSENVIKNNSWVFSPTRIRFSRNSFEAPVDQEKKTESPVPVDRP